MPLPENTIDPYATAIDPTTGEPTAAVSPYPDNGIGALAENTNPEELDAGADMVIDSVMPEGSPEEKEAIKRRALMGVQENLNLLASGKADFDINNPESIVASMKKRASAYSELGNIAQQQARAAQSPELEREAVIGAVLTQIFPIIAGAAIAGSEGAIIGLGAGATGAKVIADDAIKRGEDTAKLYNKQASEYFKQAALESKNAETGALKTSLQREKELARSERDREKLLKEAGGLSKAEEQVLIQKAKNLSDPKHEAETHSAVQRLNNIIDITEKNLKSEFKGGAVTKKFINEMIRIFPDLKGGELEQAKQASVSVVMSALGESLAKSSNIDLTKIEAEIRATAGNSAQDFLTSIKKFRELAILGQIRRDMDYAETASLLNFAPERIPTIEDSLRKYGRSRLARINDSKGINMFPITFVYTKDPKTGEVIKITDINSIYKLDLNKKD